MGDTQGNIFGISPRDGSIIWMRELNTKIIASPLFRDEAVFLATMGGRLHAFHVQDGSDYWNIPKVKVIGVKGAIQMEKDEKGEALKKNYVVLIKYKYNFDPRDYFGHKEKSEKSNIEIALFDESKLPIKYEDEGTEQDLIMIKEIDPGKHIGSGAQTQIKEITLVDTPDKEKGWSISVVVKDSKSNIIDTLETEISFELAEKKEEL
jgi:hypothetical protein